VLVADFSRVLAGPYATMLLADLGATVVKVEPPRGDDTRTWAPPVRVDPERGDTSSYFLSVNRGKRSIVLDLTDEDDRAVAHELARRADVVVENFRTGGMERFGLGYEQVAATNPGVVYASITGFGSRGGAGLPGYDLVVQAVSGLMSTTGDADGPGYRSGVAVFDVVAGLHADLGIVAALHHRTSTGLGQHVEVNLLSSALSGMVNQTGAVVSAGVVPHRMGNAHPSLFPYEPVDTADGQLVLAVGNDGQFAALCRELEVPELVADPRFTRNADRTVHRDALRPLLLERLRTRTSAQWAPVLTAAGVPCGVVGTVADGLALATELGLDPVVAVGGIPTVRHPVTYSATPAVHHLPPPNLDEHGAELRAWLAMTPPAQG
jgi:crotonobetainyl-CoA:carnitine CoA-transferase CaiB-like acyl-CoA transferase